MSEPIWCPDCGKRCYASRGEAKRSGRRFASEGGHRGHRYRAYQCGDWWHLTSWQAAARVAAYRDHERSGEKEPA